MNKFLLLIVLIFSVLFVSGCCDDEESTIAVIGAGTVMVQPDVMQMHITLSNVARTTQIASQAVNVMVRESLEILKEAGIEDKNIATAHLNFRSEYEYTHRRILVGQRAEQGISFSIENIVNDNEKVSQIIDKLIQINGIELNYINFSVKNNAEHFVKSRDLAFQKATEKANQFANLSGRKICKVLSISEEGMQPISPILNRSFQNQIKEESAVMNDAAGSTVLPAGEIEITSRVIVVFLLK